MADSEKEMTASEAKRLTEEMWRKFDQAMNYPKYPRLVACRITGIVAKVNNEAEHRAFVRTGVVTLVVCCSICAALCIGMAVYALMGGFR